ncbi:MAG: hypothetical protein ACLFPX_07870 [Candidatus Omnitrophota bacterium]
MALHGHTVHVPVMGTGFTLDTPLKIARFGLSSVVSLVDDTLIEQTREYYCRQYDQPYQPIKGSDPDCRARRITAYLNLLDVIVQKQIEDLRSTPFEPGSEITAYFSLLPDTSELKKRYTRMLSLDGGPEKTRLQEDLRAAVRPGSIDVNIMTKLDRLRRDKNGEPLPMEDSEALAALRGFAESTVDAAIVLSAGLNQRLFSYMEKFKNFYADSSGSIKKRIILKVSDFRSSLLQGKIFAKKGLWISEYRFESGLNCGGHAFASNGVLLGPILEEFRTKREEFFGTITKAYLKGVNNKDVPLPDPLPPVRFTVQGGICTAEEDRFLREHYSMDGTGWGTPFLLCPDVTSVDAPTRQKLAIAEEDDLYLSDSSPINVPFNNLRSSTSEINKRERIARGDPGAPCVKGHLAFNEEFGQQLCLASRTYQQKKIAQLKEQDLDEETFQAACRDITAKACICHELGNGLLEEHGIIPAGSRGVAVCPGPNLAYFSGLQSLKSLLDHIYARGNVLNDRLRPHVFIKELLINLEDFRSAVSRSMPEITDQQRKSLNAYRKNLLDGIAYYEELFDQVWEAAEDQRRMISEQLSAIKEQIEQFSLNHPSLFSST